MVILLVLVPINHERDIYKNSDPQKPQDTLTL